MNTGTSIANKVVITLLVLILAALGVVIYQNSQKPGSGSTAQTAQVAAESTEAASEVPAEQAVDAAPIPVVVRPRPTALKPPTPTVIRRTTVAVPTPVLPIQEVNTPAEQLGLVPVPVPVPGGAAVGGGVETVSEGEVSGRILLSGTPPAEIPIMMDATCGRLQSGPVTTRHYVVNSEGALVNVFVYIKQGLERARFATPKDTPVIDNINCMFEPYVMGVQTGQKFLVRNDDSTLHNFHITARVNRERNIALAFKGQTSGIFLDKPEVLVRVKCDVHPWMFAYIGAVSHPFYAVSDTNGVFKLPPGLPEGNYTLAAYHQKAGELTKEITVRQGEKQHLDFQFTVPGQVNPKVVLGNQ
jgi:hypothetical protein